MTSMEFNNVYELYDRVKPALYSKCKEIRNMGYSFVNEKDIWNYLVNNNWKERNDLNLNDLVSDILYVDNYMVYDYVLSKIKNTRRNEDESVL